MTDFSGEDHRRGHILLELGFRVTRSGDEIHGSAPIVPEMWVPGTGHLRASILATWADTAAGYLAIDLLAPRVPVTLELDIHLHQAAPGSGTVHVVARTVKAGRSVVVLGVDVTDDGGGEPVAMGTASFMAAPDPRLTISRESTRLAAQAPPGGPLKVPFAERAGCERRAPGVAVLRRSDDGLNAAGSVNGGLMALVVEEAALSVAAGTTLSSLALRYLRAVRVGPATGDLGQAGTGASSAAAIRASASSRSRNPSSTAASAEAVTAST